MSVRDSIIRYCQYQLRSHKEVKNKLYELGCYKQESEEIIIELIQSGILNEEAYAIAIARGRFRMKQWGKNKIVAYLKRQDISDYCIQKALREIEADDYSNTIMKAAEKKLAELKSEKNIFIKKQKLYRYLVQKGYESQKATAVINEVLK